MLILSAIKYKYFSVNFDSSRGNIGGETMKRAYRTLALMSVVVMIQLLVVLGVRSVAWADTTVSEITGITTWSLAGSPYIVTNDLTVESGVILTVEAGVTVKFNSGLALNISGTLNASGTGANPVTFTSGQASPAVGSWGGKQMGASRGQLRQPHTAARRE